MQVRTERETAWQQIKVKILYKIDRLCAGINFFYAENTVEQQQQYATRLSGTFKKLLDRMQMLQQRITDDEKIKSPLEMFIIKWTRKAIYDSLMAWDGRFISDNNYLLQFFPDRRWKWKTLFPLFKP